MSPAAGSALDTARRLADDLLFPSALDTDRSPLVPVAHLDALADAGFYGLACPDGAGAGGLGVDRREAARLVEILAGGCLTTTFVWLQHHGAVGAVLGAAAPVREQWASGLCAGRVRAGIAIAGVRTGHVTMRATRAGGGWVFDGSTSWVTGWGRIDLVLTAARTDDDEIVWALIDAREGPALSVEPLPLVAVEASGTVVLRLARHVVGDDRVTGVEPAAEWAARDAAGLRMNGSLSLGVAGRCAALLGSEALGAEVDRCRETLDSAGAEAMPTARAAASELAWRAAGALVAGGGSRSVLMSGHAQRLAREAAFLLVFGQRPSIRAALLARFGAEPA